MPTAKIPAKRLRENYIFGEKDLRRVYGERLTQRGFRLDLPLTVERTEEELIVTQDVPGRVPNNDPRLWPLLQRVGRAEPGAPSEVLAMLLAEGDDRADVLTELEASMPDGLESVAADFGTQTDGDPATTIPASEVATRELCKRVLVLFGLREERM